MHIGLIGGIGVASTDFYYRNLVAEMQRRGRDLDMTIVHADAPSLLANFLANRQDAQAGVFAGLTERLKRAGAGCVAISSIGGHFCVEPFKALSVLPVVDLREAIATRLKSQEFEKVGILGTNTAMQTGLYGYLKMEVLTPEGGALQQVHQAYVDMALAAHVTDSQRQMFFDAGRDLADRGAETVLLGGTDLFLAFDGQDPGFPTIDGAQIHVEALAELASAS